MNKNMSVKSFLTKCNSNKASISASAFITAHTEYLLTGEVSYATAPIVQDIVAGKIPATPALQSIKKVVLDHILEVERQKAEESLIPRVSSASKPFKCRIVDAATGEVCLDDKGDDLIKTFEKPQDAERWADRRLFDGSPSWYGEVCHKDMPWSVVDRNASIGRVLKRPMAPVSKGSPKSSGLGFGVKVKESVAKFSGG
jgi:hypothetical protein